MSWLALQRSIEASRSPFLLDYRNLATFTRALEGAAVDPRRGWAWYDTVTPWPGVDVPRIAPDGAILIEGARTNRVLRNREFDNAAAWNSLSGPITSGQSAPDGSTSAQRVQSAVSTRTGPEQIGTFTGGLGSLYVRKGAGSGYYVLYTQGNDAGYVFGTAPVGWTRITDAAAAGFFYVQDGRGHVVLVGGAGEPATDCDAVLDLAQDEAGAFASSPIRTTTATVTRPPDFATFSAVPPAIVSGIWVIHVWPEWDTATAPATAYIYWMDANNYLAVISGNTLRLRANGTNFDITGLSFTAKALRRIQVDFVSATRTVRIDGASPVTITQDWTGAAGTLVVGSDDTPANQFFGMVGRPTGRNDNL